MAPAGCCAAKDPLPVLAPVRELGVNPAGQPPVSLGLAGLLIPVTTDRRAAHGLIGKRDARTTAPGTADRGVRHGARLQAQRDPRLAPLRVASGQGQTASRGQGQPQVLGADHLVPGQHHGRFTARPAHSLKCDGLTSCSVTTSLSSLASVMVML
jgi:hypothetical protein